MKIIPATHHHLSILIDIDSYAKQSVSRIDEIKAWLDSQEVYLLEVNSEVVGYGVLHHHFFSQPFIELVMIARAYRQKGYGKNLITYFQKNIMGDKLFTSTNQSNHTMRNMLTQLEFIESGSIENLDKNDPEIIYCFIKR